MQTSAPPIVDVLAHEDQSDFVSKTYLHVALAVGVFALVEYALFYVPFMYTLAGYMVQSRWGWLIVLGLFMFVSHIATQWAHSGQSKQMQYAGLFTYTIAEAIIFFPLLLFAHIYDPTILPTAGLVTLSIFGGLSLFVHLTRIDFSFLRMFLVMSSFAAMGFILVSILFGFSMGSLFTIAMILLASGYILYNTSNILHVYRPGQHVAAALNLFASVALLFWYVVQLFMARD